MYKVLERIILSRLIKHLEETTRDEQAGFRPGRSTIDQVFIVRRVIEIWQRYSKPMQLEFLDFEAAFDSPHRGRVLNALRADGVQRSLYRSWLQPMDYVYALINASRCGSLRDLDRKSGWTDN
ncbi:hypothetical protein RB195_010127 [Necator americanus]|uniref:Reverse transcriptase domain-containing protein n=1 Tax=Necator americanus TaxID=51031 RepID=A0ABR1CWJ7_NECAM